MATYFVDATSGSDAANGLTTGTAWQTIAKVNASSFSAGDTISFKRGETWRELLTIPSSGSAGNLITFQDYDSGELPRITGANLVSGWTQDTLTPVVTDTFESGSPDAYWNANTGTSTDDAAVFLNGAHSRRFAPAGDMYLGRSGGTNTNYVELIAYIRVDATSTAVSGNKARIMATEGSGWNGANGVFVWVDKSGSQYRLSVGRGSAVGTTFNISPDTWYLVRYCVTANTGGATAHAEMYVDGVLRSTLTSMTLASSIDSTMRFGLIGFNPAAFIVNFDDVKVYTTDSSAQPDRWYATVTTQPNVVIIGRAVGTLVASAAVVTSSGQWFWSSNTLYVYSVGDPGGTAVEAGARSNVVVRNSKDYIKLQHLQIEGANSTTLDGAVLVNGGTGWQIDGLLAQFNRSSGLFFNSIGGTVTNSSFNYNGNIGCDFDTADGCTGTDITAHHNTFVGVYQGAITPTANNNVLSRLTCYNNGHGFALDNSDNTIVQDSLFYSNTNNGVWVTNVGNTDGAIFRRNRSYSNGDCGFSVDGSTHTNALFLYNLSYLNTNQGFFVTNGATSTLWYHNVAYGNGVGFQVTAANTTCTATNNIAFDNTVEVVVSASVDQALIINFNDWFHTAGGNFLNWKGTASGFASWKTNSVGDANSISADPLFKSVAGREFSLTSASPCRDTGVDLGSPYQDSLHRDSRWPNDVRIVDQDTQGTGWDIGAYSYLRFFLKVA